MNAYKYILTEPFYDLRNLYRFLNKKRRLIKSSELLTTENFFIMLYELRRHNSFAYINNGTLTDEYFKVAKSSLEDEAIYIILSDTGSIPSQVISIFTEEKYNHVSISFDRDLHTLVSYNGGEQVNPPGLNCETLSFFAQKEDSSAIVYSLKVTSEQKLKMIEKIKEINDCGSAYNLIGLLIQKSFKPNIMYCSQFVYTMLECAGVNYFEKNNSSVKPTDLIELDCCNNLRFEYEIEL